MKFSPLSCHLIIIVRVYKAKNTNSTLGIRVLKSISWIWSGNSL
jgi:hypothetical protein